MAGEFFRNTASLVPRQRCDGAMKVLGGNTVNRAGDFGNFMSALKGVD